MQRGDVDIEGQTLAVQRTQGYTPGKGHFLGEPKSRRSRRKVAVLQVTALVLRSHRERLEAEYADRRSSVNPDCQVCALPDSRMMKPNILSRAFRLWPSSATSRAPGATTCATPMPACCWGKGPLRTWSSRGWGTRTSALRWTFTAMSASAKTWLPGQLSSDSLPRTWAKCGQRVPQKDQAKYGEVAEWLKAPVSKTGISARVSRVRIPLSPPDIPPTTS